MEEDEGEEPMKKLYDYSILDWGIPENGSMDPRFLEGGNTVLKENLGVESLEEEVGEYLVHASASKHLVNVHRCDKDYQMRGVDEIPLEEELFFKGSIAIYKDDVLVKDDSIWYGVKANRKFGLEELIFEDVENEEEREKIVEAIINGYEYRDEMKKRARQEEKIQMMEEGEKSGRWKQRHGILF